MDGRTALIMASREGHEAVVRTLLSSGANVNQASVRNDDDDVLCEASCERALVVMVAAMWRACGWWAIVIGVCRRLCGAEDDSGCVLCAMVVDGRLDTSDMGKPRGSRYCSAYADVVWHERE